MIAFLLFLGFIYLIVDISTHETKWKKRVTPLAPFGRLLVADARAIGRDILGLVRRVRGRKATAKFKSEMDDFLKRL